MKHMTRPLVLAALTALSLNARAGWVPRTTPDTILQIVVDYDRMEDATDACLDQVIADLKGESNLVAKVAAARTALMTSLRESLESEEDLLGIDTKDVAWIAADIVYSPAMMMMNVPEPEVGMVTALHAPKAAIGAEDLKKLVALEPHAGVPCYRYHKEGLVRSENYRRDDLFLALLAPDLVLVATTDDLLVALLEAYRTPAGMGELVLPPGVMATFRTAPIGATLDRFGLGQMVRVYFEQCGDPEMGELLMAVGPLSLSMRVEKRDLACEFALASENAETCAMFGDVFGTFALALRLSADANGVNLLPGSMLSRRQRERIKTMMPYLVHLLRLRRDPGAAVLQARMDVVSFFVQLLHNDEAKHAPAPAPAPLP